MTALALKYRPKTFRTLVGQRTAKNILSSMIKKDNLPPLLLLQGPRGSGKTSAARIVARRANCQKPREEHPCLKCLSCKTENHPDITEINAADKRGVDDVRRIIDVCRLAPQFKRRVYILDEAHAFTPVAAQTALKLFEEPPPHVTFIMVTTNPEKLPRTILSRAQQVPFRTVATDLLSKRLVAIAKKEDAEFVSIKHAKKIAEASTGHPRDALNLLEKVIANAENEGGDEVSAEIIAIVVKEVVADSPGAMVRRFVDAVVDGNLSKAFTISGKVEAHEYFLMSVVDMLRGLVRYTVSPNLVENSYQAAQLAKMRKCDLEGATELLRVFARAYQEVKHYLVPANVVIDLAIAESAPPTED